MPEDYTGFERIAETAERAASFCVRLSVMMDDGDIPEDEYGQMEAALERIKDWATRMKNWAADQLEELHELADSVQLRWFEHKDESDDLIEWQED